MSLNNLDEAIYSAEKSTLQKALEFNLDSDRYGTIAEIGAGQEVARYFFRAGGAAGSIAKTMSAYDMKVSNEIYGEGTRFVSKDRCEKMMEYEYEVLVERLRQHRSTSTQFFAFADTVAAKSFKGNRECHGWMGIKLQLYPNAEASSVIIHVKMLDDTAAGQQDALGILGVNLIYAAYQYWKDPCKLLESLRDNLYAGDKLRIGVDMAVLSGNCFAHLDSRLINLHLIETGLTDAIMFNAEGQVVVSSEALYKKSPMVLRGHFRPVTNVTTDMMNCALTQFQEEHTEVAAKDILVVAELTAASLMTAGKTKYFQKLSAHEAECQIDKPDFLGRVDMIRSLGWHVLVTSFGEFYRLRQYLNAYTKREMCFVLSTRNIHDIFNEQFYKGIEGGILEVFGKLFTGDTCLYVYPSVCAKRKEVGLETLEDVELEPHLVNLLDYLKARKFVRGVVGFDETLLSIDATQILGRIKRGDGSWAEFLPDSVYQVIKTKRLLGYGTV